MAVHNVISRILGQVLREISQCTCTGCTVEMGALVQKKVFILEWLEKTAVVLWCFLESNNKPKIVRIIIHILFFAVEVFANLEHNIGE